MAYLKRLRGNFDIFLSLVRQHGPRSQQVLQVALDLILRRKGISTEALTFQHNSILAGLYPDLMTDLQQLLMLRRLIGQRTLDGPGLAAIEAHQRLLAEWDAQKERLEAKLARRIPEMSLAQKLSNANRMVIADALPADSALVEFIRVDLYNFAAIPAQGQHRWGPAHYLAFVLHAGKPDSNRTINWTH